MNKKPLIGLIIFLGFIFWLRFTGVGDYITIEQLKAHRSVLLDHVAQHYCISVLLFIVLYTCCIAINLPVAAILTITGGLLFGTFWGAIYSNVGATIGASVAFLSVRYIIGSYIQKNYSYQLAWFNRHMQKDGVNYLLSIHLVAVVPFFLINVLAGLTQVPLWTFVWTTSAGIFPGSFVYSFAGQQLNTIKKVSDIFSLNIIFAFIGLTILAFLPVLIKRFKKKNI